MKPKNLKFNENTNVLSCDDVPDSTRFDAYATGKNGVRVPGEGSFPYNLINSAYVREGTFPNIKVVFRNIHDKFILDETQKYWIESKDINKKSYKSDELEVKRGDVVPPDPDPDPEPNDTIAKLIEAERLISEVRESLM